MFTALHRDDFMYSADSLEDVLAFVLDCIDPTFAEDAVVWKGGLVVAVVLSMGTVVRFDSATVPVRFAPADLVILDETAA
jgi:hypothetical protein